MIKSIDELETAETDKIKQLCRHLDPDIIAIAMHGVSPVLAAKFNKSMPAIQRLKVFLSPYKRHPVKIETVEKAHQDIVKVFKSLK
jgi:hypothetical protein